MSVTPVPRSSARQGSIIAYIDLTFAMVATGVDEAVIEVPPGAVIRSGEVIVDTAFNSVTSDVLSVGDSNTYNLYLSAHTIAATGLTAIVPTGYIYTTPTLLSVRWVGVGTAPSAGALRLVVEYYRRGRDQFPQGEDYVKRLA